MAEYEVGNEPNWRKENMDQKKSIESHVQTYNNTMQQLKTRKATQHTQLYHSLPQSQEYKTSQS